MKDYSIWQEELINISSFADGQTHNITFEADIELSGKEVKGLKATKNTEALNLFLDD